MSLSVVVFAVCTLACLVGHIAILRSVLRSRSAVAEAGVPRPRLGVEIVWAVLPALALLALLTATWSHVQQREHPEPGIVLRVAR